VLFTALRALGERDAVLAEARREHAKSVEQFQTATKRSVEEAEANAQSAREQLAADNKRSGAQLEAHDKQAVEEHEATTKHAAEQLEATTKRAAEQADSSDKQIGDLRGEVQSLRAELDTAGVEMKSSSAAVAALQSQLERGETALQATRRESERLKIRAAEYLERLRSREWRRQDAEISMRTLDAQFATSQDGAAKFEREARELNARVEALGNRIQERWKRPRAAARRRPGARHRHCKPPSRPCNPCRNRSLRTNLRIPNCSMSAASWWPLLSSASARCKRCWRRAPS
jgi:chromosome segregation ATPase